MNYSEFNVVFTKRDHEIMDSYAKTLTELGRFLGTGYEILLHSLENCQKSAIVVINGVYTDRQVGAPITDLAITMLQQFLEIGTTEGAVYFTRNQKGAPMKSTTIPIQGEGDKIIGLICINFYLDSPLSALIEEWTPKDEKHREETFLPDHEDGVELFYELLTSTRDKVYQDGSIPHNCKNKEIVQRLYRQGAFTRKDAVRITSEFLSISKNTIYLHIRNIEK